ncbi:hypothetical protein VPSG_00033 [Vibrio phage pYD38-B]|uniref:hypothetical protein n=1 Tax=Vibrio phage pYD38-B TaxID=929835 RepID=UPI0003425FC7|nr:hypothetical protein VPSG_00033 [Vibrio phage pYD38-B]AGN34352.1 hypothetical protein VPSG_00033 [Vibrio phage pYD38-B]
MTLQDYEERFLGELIENWPGIDWDKYVRQCHEEYMDSIDEAKIAEWENSL